MCIPDNKLKNSMSNLNAKTLLSDPAMRDLLKTNNYLATRDLVLRLLVELILMYIIYFLFQRDHFIIALCCFYMLAIWHSFWGYAGIGHEFMHARVFSNKYINRIFYYLSSALVWSNATFLEIRTSIIMLEHSRRMMLRLRVFSHGR